jgi:hypothetical protein
MKEVLLGKIKSVSFGFGGSEDYQIGLSLHFGGGGWGVSKFYGFWSNNKAPSFNKESDMVELCYALDDILCRAKVSSVDRLKGIPVEVTFIDGALKAWRILEEVL